VSLRRVEAPGLQRCSLKPFSQAGPFPEPPRAAKVACTTAGITSEHPTGTTASPGMVVSGSRRKHVQRHRQGDEPRDQGPVSKPAIRSGLRHHGRLSPDSAPLARSAERLRRSISTCDSRSFRFRRANSFACCSAHRCISAIVLPQKRDDTVSGAHRPVPRPALAAYERCVKRLS
jgi:hypothetical protein